jgi:phosphopantothenoylcysteine decarboxylase/phosphopantothenate--cysteine ligase
MEILKDKKIVFGITGSISAYKVCDIVSFLTKNGANITCILTESAKEFVTVKTLETLSKNKVITELFPNNNLDLDVEHVSLADQNDLLIVAPATANIISKFASGIADDFLTTFFLANRAPILIAPAMNTNMYLNKIIQSNMQKLLDFDMNLKFIEPSTGALACGKDGIGRLADKDVIINAIYDILF